MNRFFCPHPGILKDEIIIKDKEKVRNLVEGDYKSPFIVNSSIFKNPQSFVIASHVPERDFVLNLLNNYEYIDA